MRLEGSGTLIAMIQLIRVCKEAVDHGVWGKENGTFHLPHCTHRDNTDTHTPTYSPVENIRVIVKYGNSLYTYAHMQPCGERQGDIQTWSSL